MIGLPGSYGLDGRRVSLQHCDLGRPANQVLCLRGSETARGMPLVLYKSAPLKRIRHILLCICIGCLFTSYSLHMPGNGKKYLLFDQSEYMWPFRKQSVDIIANHIEVRGFCILIYLGYNPFPQSYRKLKFEWPT